MWWLSDFIPLQIKSIWNIFIFQFLETSTSMFMASKQQTPGSTNTGKIIYYIGVNKAALSLSDLTHFFVLFCFFPLFLLTETSQLLLIVSDGRGLFLEGKERVAAAVQAARSANIFVIFVVLDNPNSRVRNLIWFCVHSVGLAKLKNTDLHFGYNEMRC